MREAEAAAILTSSRAQADTSEGAVLRSLAGHREPVSGLGFRRGAEQLVSIVERCVVAEIE